jgi:hypothetical protein
MARETEPDPDVSGENQVTISFSKRLFSRVDYTGIFLTRGNGLV